jgi:serine/threonine-protein kinase RsbW
MHADPQPVMNIEVIDLTVPADPAYLSVMRSATAGLGTHLNLTTDEIEDLQIAVDEACALLIAGREHPDRLLATNFTVDRGTLTIRIDGPAAVLPDDGSFAWTMLHALSTDLGTGRNDDGSWIAMTCRGQGVPA